MGKGKTIPLILQSFLLDYFTFLFRFNHYIITPLVFLLINSRMNNEPNTVPITTTLNCIEYMKSKTNGIAIEIVEVIRLVSISVVVPDFNVDVNVPDSVVVSVVVPDVEVD